jgi:hypothetical protein
MTAVIPLGRAGTPQDATGVVSAVYAGVRLHQRPHAALRQGVCRLMGINQRARAAMTLGEVAQFIQSRPPRAWRL